MKKLILSSLLVSQSFAASFVIPSGTTETAPQTLFDSGDAGLVEEDAFLNVAGTAVQMLNSNQSMDNNGQINTTTYNAFGVSALNANNSTVENRGLISTVGVSSDGINVDSSDDFTVINHGTISTSNTSAAGIANDSGQRIQIYNKGLIRTEGQAANAILNNSGSDASIVNSGKIVTNNIASSGIRNNSSSNVSILNKGTIDIFGVSSNGIANNFSDNAVIENQGTIHAYNISGVGINFGGDNVHIINSGTIISDQSFAIAMFATNQQLTLKAGSNIQGGVLSLNDNLDLNVKKGLNLALTLDDSGEGFGDLNIDNPFLQFGNTIVVVDRTTFALQSDVVADLSDTVLGGIYRHRFGFGSDCCDEGSGLCGYEGWIEAIGSYRNSRSQHYIASYNNWNSGFLVGVNTEKCGGYLGAFAGYLYGKASVSHNASEATTNNVIGGVTYEKLNNDSFLGAALALGYVNWKNDRHVMNNLVIGGVQHARYNQNAFLLSPEITWIKNLDCLCYRPNFSATARYAGLFLGSCSESGSTYNLKVNDRQVHLLTGRAELGIPVTSEICGSCLSFEPYLGGQVRFQPGSRNIDGEILGESLNFKDPSKDVVGAFLYGFRTSHSRGDYNFYMNFEGSVDSASSRRYLGEIGIAKTF